MGSVGKMRRSKCAPLMVAASLLAMLPAVAEAATAASDTLQAGFENPPQSARPRVWWHWLNGNITKDGISKDLHWMSRIGIGGMQSFDAALGTPQIVDKRLAYMTPEWKDAFKFATTLADQLHLELGIAASPGWSETGGPWVEPKDGMKKVVWSETVVSGGTALQVKLPAPPKNYGPFQDLRAQGLFGPATVEDESKRYYADIAVFAVPIDANDPAAARYDADGKAIDGGALADGRYSSSVAVLRAPNGQDQHVVATFDQPETIRSATVFVEGVSAMTPGDADDSGAPTLDVSQDGQTWTTVAKVPLAPVPTTVGFAAVTARYFRLTMKAQVAPDLSSIWAPAPGAIPMRFGSGAPDPNIHVAEFRLSADPKVTQFEEKAGYDVRYPAYVAAKGGPEVGVDSAKIIDITDHVGADGTLNWTPPAGRWRVLRMGYSLEGTENHPATAEATGLEVDKYDGKAVAQYMKTYLDMYSDTVGADMLGKRGLRAMVNDSTEVGASNWTPELLAHFKALRGYDARPWLPVLAGVLVGSRTQSDQFLYDFRRTLEELNATQHYAVVAKAAQDRGLVTYGEALETLPKVLGDDLEMRRYTNVPMAAMWSFDLDKGPQVGYLADMKGASSVAHVFGQNLAAAESLTTAFHPWAFSPADLQPMIDVEFASGINRPVIHTSVHQPTDDKLPGLSLGPFGQYFTRHETWAEMAKPWVTYIARNSFLLQQGQNVADVAYFFGEESPLSSLYLNTPVQDAPKRYGYDFVNAAILNSELSVEGGYLVAKHGARYRALYLGGTSQRMTVATLQRLKALAEDGAIIVGKPPQGTLSETDDPNLFSYLVAEMWSGGYVTQVGKGKVYASVDIEGSLKAAGDTPDIDFKGVEVGKDVLFVHRHARESDIYFVTNRTPNELKTDARFRVVGRAPEIWRADTGAISDTSYRNDGDATVVPLTLAPWDSFFVVFRKVAKTPSATVPVPVYLQAVTLEGTWDVSFEGLASPKPIRMAQLQSLSESLDAETKYFSGVITYRKSFTVTKAIAGRHKVILSLGKIGDVAEVEVNGRAVGGVWRAPYSIDIAKALRPGKNTIAIHVADLWVNRLIGDAQPGAKKVTWAPLPSYRSDAPLRPSGLIGPVTISVSAD